MSADLFNAGLELVGGGLLWLHVRRAQRAGKIVGVHWLPALFFGIWALWNCFYYPMLGQWFSAVAAVAPFVANAAFLRLYWRLGRA